VRFALGASRKRILGQLLTESVLLSVTGGALGILLAYWGVYSLASFVSANFYSRVEIDVAPDARVLILTLIGSVLTGILFGLVPAFRGIRVNLAPTLKESATSSSGAAHATGRRFSIGSSLVVAQVALSIVLLIGAGLLVRTLANLRGINPGFSTGNLLHFGIDPTLTGYKKDRIQSLYGELQGRLASLPGVISTSYSSEILLNDGLWSSDVHIEGQPEKSNVNVNMLAVGPSFFETMRIPLLEGRNYVASDFRSEQAVALVNQTFARRYLPGKNALGLHLGSAGDEDHVSWEIIGVVADAHYATLRHDVDPTVYLPLRGGAAYFELRTAANPSALIPAIRQVVSGLDNDLPLTDVRTETETIDHLLFNERLVARLSSLFGALALILAAVGLYGLLSYEVARRTREIGIRTALGAQGRDVLRLVVGQGIVLAAIGLVTGAALALGVTRYLQTLLYGVKATDPLTFMGVAIVLMFVALAACYFPGRRATRVDPMVALRYE